MSKYVGALIIFFMAGNVWACDGAGRGGMRVRNSCGSSCNSGCNTMTMAASSCQSGEAEHGYQVPYTPPAKPARQQEQTSPFPSSPLPLPQEKVPAPMLEDSVQEYKTKANPDLIVHYKGKINSVEHIFVLRGGKQVKVPVINGYMPQFNGNVVRYTAKIPFDSGFRGDYARNGYVNYSGDTLNKIASN